jgi:ribonuclease P/MRP protein subunit RPP25
MDNYIKKDKPKEKTEENEIRVTSKGFIRNYFTYAEKVLAREDQKSLIISATGNAIVKALILIEMVKRRVGNLHQTNEITSREMIDTFEPKIEGLEEIVQKRRVTAMKTVLSKDPLEESDIGYQAPEAKEDLPPRQERPHHEKR